MAISQEQPPFEIDEELREYLIRFRTDVDNEFRSAPKFPERREMPYKPQVGDVHYFGDLGTHDYDAAITAEGFWGYSDPDGWRQLDTGGVEEAPIDGTTYGRNNGTWVSVAGGGGDVTGPAGATDNAIARYDGTTGKLIQDSTAIITDTGNLDVSGSILVSGTVDGRDVNNDGTNLDNHIGDATIHFTEGSIDHLNIQNIGTNSHAAIDTHIADGTIHFTEASIDHTAILNIGINSHAAIDSHISDATIHFTEASIDHTAILNVGTNTHAQIDSHIADGTIHFTEASIDHTAIQNVGSNTHAQIDTHIADTTIHFTEASIDHINIQNVGLNTHAAIDSHIADGTIHFTEGSIDHLNIQNIGVNSHAAIDSHIADGTIHFTESSIDHLNILNVGTNTHAQIDSHIADTDIHFSDAPADGNTYGRNNNSWVQTGGGGASISAVWQYDDTTTSGDPGSGNFRTDNNTIASMTQLYISDETKNGVDFSNILGALNIGDEIYLQNGEDSNEAALVTITGITDNTTWYSFDITVNDTGSSVTWTDGKEFGFIFLINQGSFGDVSGPASSTDEAVARFDGTTGKLIQNSVVTIDDTGNIATPGTVDGRDVSADGTTLDNHIADATIHFTEASIDHLNIQNIGVNSHAAIDTHIADTTIHFTEASIDHTAIQNVGTNTHAQIDAHIADTDIHYSDAPADGNNYGRNNNAWVDLDALYVTVGAPDQTITSVKTFAPFATGVLGQDDIVIGDPTDYGLIGIGNATFGRTNFNAGALDLDGSMLSFNEALPATSNIEFAWADGTANIRFALAVPGVGNATYSPRSMLVAGPAVLDDDIVTVGYWQGQGIFDNLVCDTAGQGADFGIQNDLEVEGIIYTDNIQESTPAAAITLQANPGTVDGQMLWDGNEISLFPSDINFGEGYLFGWGPTGDPTTPFANRWNLNSASGFNFIMSNANFPQFIIGSTDPTSAWFVDGNGNKDIRFNTLDTGFDQDNVVYFGYGGINLQDDGGDAIFLRSPFAVAGTYTITLPDTDGDVGQILVNTDGAATLDWVDGPVTAVPAAYTESGSTNITTTAATVAYDTEELDPDANCAIAAGELTVTSGGYFDVSYSLPCTIDSGGGATRGKITAFMERDQGTGTWITIPQSFSACYTREATAGTGLSAAFNMLIADGEAIRVRVACDTTTDLSTTAGQSSLSIHRLRAA